MALERKIYFDGARKEASDMSFSDVESIISSINRVTRSEVTEEPGTGRQGRHSEPGRVQSFEKYVFLSYFLLKIIYFSSAF